MTIKNYLVPVDNEVMTVNPNSPMIVRDRKDKDLPVKFFLPLHKFKEFDDYSHGNSHTVGILSVSNIKCLLPTFDFACQERKIRLSYAHKVRYVIVYDLSHPLSKLFELFVRKYRPCELYRIVGL